MRPKRGRKIGFTELILNFELITKLPPTASLSSLLCFPCTTPTGGAVRRRHRTPPAPPGRPHVAPPTKLPAHPRVEPKPLRPGFFSARHAPRRRPCVTRRQWHRRSPSPASVALPGQIDLPQTPPHRLPAGPPPPRTYRRRHIPCARLERLSLLAMAAELGSPWNSPLRPHIAEIDCHTTFPSYC